MTPNLYKYYGMALNSTVLLLPDALSLEHQREGTSMYQLPPISSMYQSLPIYSTYQSSSVTSLLATGHQFMPATCPTPIIIPYVPTN